MPSDESEPPGVAIGYAQVDAQPEVAMLIECMELTAQWPAVRQLRDWERTQLALQPGERLVDVGCGLGDVAITLAADVAPSGSVVAIDASDAMLEVGRQHAIEAKVPVQFQSGNAQALPMDDCSVDACRCERALQWVPDAHQALAEMVRVLRPGGRISVIDTDWRTLAFDLPDPAPAAVVKEAVQALRGPAFDMGGRLLNMCRDVGLGGLAVSGAVHVWADWDPDTQLTPPGLFPIRLLADDLVRMGRLDAQTAERFVSGVEDAARRDRLCISVSMLGVAGRRPAGTG